jgi:hypothetical protein
MAMYSFEMMSGSLKMNNIKLVVTNDGMPEGEGENLKAESPGSPMAGLSVGSFIQLISMDQQTCLVEVYHSANGKGTFYFVEGTLYNAVCGSLEGEDAAMEMITWEKVRININNNITANEIGKKIDKGLLSLLMESSRRKDESAWDDRLETSEMSVVNDEENEDDISVTTMLDNNDKKQILSDLAIAGEPGAGSVPGGTEPVPDDKIIGENRRAEETSSETGSKSEIVKILEKASGIIEYCVFDERDILQDKSSGSNAIMHIAPSLHFNLSDSFCDLVGGRSLKYLVFRTHGGVHYLLVRMNKLQVVVGLDPGIKPGDFLNQIFTDTVRL